MVLELPPRLILPHLLTALNGADQYRDIVFPAVSQLVRAVLIDGDEKLSDSVKNVLFKNLAVSTTESQSQYLRR
jgi:hypothetical protein